MSIEFNIIEKVNSPLIKVLSILIVLPAFGLIILKIGLLDTSNPPMSIIAMIIFISGLISIIIIMSNPWTKIIKEHREAGKLILKSDHLTINNEIIHLSKISILKLNIDSYRGQVKKAYPLGGFFSFEDGTNNRINLTLYNGSKMTLRFEIDSKIKFKKIKEILDSWYSTGLKINEKTFGHKSYLTEINLKYSEIQELKKRYLINN